MISNGFKIPKSPSRIFCEIPNCRHLAFYSTQLELKITFLGLPRCFGCFGITMPLWCWLKCCFSLSDREKCLPHSAHENGLSPVWVRLCLWRWDKRKNDKLQKLHWWGFTPEWVCMCRFIFCLFKKPRLQIEQNRSGG